MKTDFLAFFMNPWFVSGLGGWLVASFAKMTIAAFKTHRFDFVYLVSTGGMPSSHSASMTALAFSIGYTEGFGSQLTVLAAAFAIVTMFDAATVRRAAGDHARILNAILQDIQTLKLKPIARLKELLGHTRTEVLWGFVTGALWATLVCWLWK